MIEHPFRPIPLYLVGDPEPIWTDWCSHLVAPEDICGELAEVHEPIDQPCGVDRREEV